MSQLRRRPSIDTSQQQPANPGQYNSPDGAPFAPPHAHYFPSSPSVSSFNSNHSQVPLAGAAAGAAGAAGAASLGRYALVHQPNMFNAPAYETGAEADDWLHSPPPIEKSGAFDAHYLHEGPGFSKGGVGALGAANLLGLAVIVSGLLFCFAGMPIYSQLTSTTPPLELVGFWNASNANDSAINSHMPNMFSRTGPIDPDTPSSAKTITGVNGDTLHLVFSDEFNTDGRQFYPNEDPYWEALDAWYWQTADDEWDDPDNIITKGGNLEITLTKETNASSHGMGYLGGMLQSWNKLCLTGGYIEMAVSLPGDTKDQGLWPAGWLLSNLGKAGYGATLDGTWPYSYEACDIGTLPNQTWVNGTGPAAALEKQQYNDQLSVLKGQKFSACTCPGEDHPGPYFSGNSSWKGRGASEIDVIEAAINLDYGTIGNIGQASQSAQWAPFDNHYYALNDSTEYQDFHWGNSTWYTDPNTYVGSYTQQSTSALSMTNASNYNSTTNFGVFGVEYTPYKEINWINEGSHSWSVYQAALAADPVTEISERVITGEPMSIIMNLGQSTGFTTVDYADLTYPATMRVDYVRVYQKAGSKDALTCDPPDFPTADYINRHMEAYTNVNYTLWSDYTNASKPLNRLSDTCS